MHEQSETIQTADGRWINVYGKATPRAGQQLPGTVPYATLDEAVRAAKTRSDGHVNDTRITPESLLKQGQEFGTRADEGMAQVQREREAENARYAEQRKADMTAQQGAATDLQSTIEKGPGQVEMPKADLGPPMDAKSYQTFAYGMLALSLVGAFAGRKHWASASAALDGALKGFKEGNLTLMAEKEREFQREFKVAQEKQKAANDQYEKVLKSKTLTLNQQAKMIEVHASEHHDWEMQAAAREKRFDLMYQKMNQNINGARQLQQQADRLAEQSRARAEKSGGGDNAIMGEETLRLKAEQYLEGDETVKRNLGRGTQGSKNIVALEEMIAKVAREKGMNARQIVEKIAEFQGMRARERTIGTREANMQTSAVEAREFANLARESATEVWRTTFVPLNKLVETVQSGTGSPEMRRFVVANRSLITAYGQVMARTGARTVHDTQEAEKMLMTADSPKAYQAGVDQILREIDVALKAPGEARKNLRNESGESRRSADNVFASEAEAAAANLKPGTRVTIGGVPGTWQ